jgi:hypothetical protein
MATSKSKSTEAPATGNDIPKTSATSAVTTDLPQQAEQDPQAEQEVADTQSQAVKNGIGLVRVDGIDLRYVGIAPARDKGAKTPGGLAITPENSTFTTLDNVAFHPSIRIKDPKSGEFYYPADGVVSWEECELNGSKLLG